MTSEHYQLIGVIAALFAILGGVYAFFKWGIDIIQGWLAPSDEVTYKIPKKTVVVLPKAGSSSTWWHMGSSSGKPAMQIVGDFTVTNLTKFNILLCVAKMKNPKILGSVLVKDFNSNYHGSYMIPGGGTTDMSFNFWIMPPLRKENESFVADVAILDQFGNEHWIKKIKFKYS